MQRLMHRNCLESAEQRIPRLARALWRTCLGLFRVVAIVGISYVALFPLLSKISSSLMAYEDLYDQSVLWVPRHFTLSYYEAAFERMNYPEAALRSFLLASVVAALQLASCSVVAYGFARYRAPGSNLLFGLVIFTLIVPPQMIMIPQYINFRYFNPFGLLPGGGINLIGTYWPAICVSMTAMGLRNGLFIYILRQYFRGMPKDLEDAAYVDGAGPFRAFCTVILPGAVPALVIVFLFAFVWQWNDYYFTTTFMSGRELLPNRLIGLPAAFGLDHNAYGTPYYSTILNTGSVLFILPLLVLYAFMQRHFVESIERTGIVG